MGIGKCSILNLKLSIANLEMIMDVCFTFCEIVCYLMIWAIAVGVIGGKIPYSGISWKPTDIVWQSRISLVHENMFE